ncbi:unnamed protein product [Closterium sp. NIES-53]
MLSERDRSWPVGPPASAAVLSVARPEARDVFSSHHALGAHGGFLPTVRPEACSDFLPAVRPGSARRVRAPSRALPLPSSVEAPLLQLAHRPCSPRAAPAARVPPLQPASRSCRLLSSCNCEVAGMGVAGV